MATTPALLPGKSHGWRSMVGCSPWGRKELDTTERLHFHFHRVTGGEESAAAAREPGPTLLHPKPAPGCPPPLRQAVGVSGSPGQRAAAWPAMSPLFSWVAKVPETVSSIQQARWEELHCLMGFDDTLARKFEALFWGPRVMALRKAPPALID